MSDQGHMGDALFRQAAELARDSAPDALADTEPERIARELASLKSLHGAAMEKVAGQQKQIDGLLHVLHQERLYSLRALSKLRDGAKILEANQPPTPDVVIAAMTEFVKASDAVLAIAQMAEAQHCCCVPEHCQFAAPKWGQSPLRKAVLLVKTRAPHLSVVERAEKAEAAIEGALEEALKP